MKAKRNSFDTWRFNSREVGGGFMAMRITSHEEYEKVMARILVLSKDRETAEDNAELKDLRDSAQAWDASRGGEVAGDDQALARPYRPENPITAMFDHLNDAEKKGH